MESMDDDADMLKPMVDEEVKEPIVTREDKQGEDKHLVDRSKRKQLKRGFKRGVATVDDVSNLLKPAEPTDLRCSKFKSEKVPTSSDCGSSSSDKLGLQGRSGSSLYNAD